MSAKLEKLRRKAQSRVYDRFYIPYGGCRQIFESQRDETVISGPAGTGKSRACLEKQHRLALEYPNSRHLIVRKTRTSLSESGLQTYEDWVLGKKNPLVNRGPARRNRVKYTYPNGSEIYAGGMDKPGRIMSTEFDTVFVQEAIELNLTDFEALTTRLRNYKTPYQQLLADTNPAFPLHWLKQRCNSGATEFINSTHKDNPRLWNQELQDWTKEGIAYIGRLGNLTGTQRQRLLEGKWVQTEGVVYDSFTEDNLTDDEPNNKMPIELAVDDGYVDPRAILFIQYSSTEILVFDEIYHSKHLPEVCIQEVIDRCEKNEWLLPELAVAPSEAIELRERFIGADITAIKGTHGILEGIDVVRSLVEDGQGVRTLKVNRRCINFISEMMGGYRYPELGTRADDEKPIDDNNHACDAFRYWAWIRANYSALDPSDLLSWV